MSKPKKKKKFLKMFWIWASLDETENIKPNNINTLIQHNSPIWNSTFNYSCGFIVFSNSPSQILKYVSISQSNVGNKSNICIPRGTNIITHAKGELRDFLNFEPNDWKAWEAKQTLSNCDKYMKLVLVFFFFLFCVHQSKIAQILKYFAQLCDCMIAAFSNSC